MSKLDINFNWLRTDKVDMDFYKKSFQRVMPFLLGPFLGACSTASLTVNSVPEKATVSIRPVGGGEAVNVGKTPLVLTRDQLKGSGANSGPIIVEIQKDDFVTEKVLVTESAAVDIKLEFALQLADKNQGLTGPGATLGDAQDLNLAIDRLFEVRKFIDLESYGEALIHLRSIEQKWPFLSAAYEMKGGVLFLQKKFRDALAAYGMALKYNPRSVSSSNMAAQLESELGIDSKTLVTEYEKKQRVPAAEKPVEEGKPAGTETKPVGNDKKPTKVINRVKKK